VVAGGGDHRGSGLVPVLRDSGGRARPPASEGAGSAAGGPAGGAGVGQAHLALRGAGVPDGHVVRGVRPDRPPGGAHRAGPRRDRPPGRPRRALRRPRRPGLQGVLARGDGRSPGRGRQTEPADLPGRGMSTPRRTASLSTNRSATACSESRRDISTTPSASGPSFSSAPRTLSTPADRPRSGRPSALLL
jgi:hypothetical protein